MDLPRRNTPFLSASVPTQLWRYQLMNWGNIRLTLYYPSSPWFITAERPLWLWTLKLHDQGLSCGCWRNFTLPFTHLCPIIKAVKAELRLGSFYCQYCAAARQYWPLWGFLGWGWKSCSAAHCIQCCLTRSFFWWEREARSNELSFV